MGQGPNPSNSAFTNLRADFSEWSGFKNNWRCYFGLSKYRKWMEIIDILKISLLIQPHLMFIESTWFHKSPFLSRNYATAPTPSQLSAKGVILELPVVHFQEIGSLCSKAGFSFPGLQLILAWGGQYRQSLPLINSSLWERIVSPGYWGE